MKKTIEILQHTIEYEYDNNQIMPEYEEKHIKDLIIKDYSSGELCCAELSSQDVYIRGWWNIVK